MLVEPAGQVWQTRCQPVQWWGYGCVGEWLTVWHGPALQGMCGGVACVEGVWGGVCKWAGKGVGWWCVWRGATMSRRHPPVMGWA